MPKSVSLLAPSPVDQHVLRLVVPVDHPAPCAAASPSSEPCSTTSAASGVVRPQRRRISRSVIPSTSSMTIAAPAGRLQVLVEPDHVRVASAAEHRRLAAEQRGELGVASRSARRYLIATSVPVASCLASTTSPEPARAERLQLGVPGSRRFGHGAASFSGSWAVSGPPEPFPGLCAVQQLTATLAAALPLPGPRTWSVTCWASVPWPCPWTAAVTYTADCPAATDWLSGCGAAACGVNTHW